MNSNATPYTLSELLDETTQSVRRLHKNATTIDSSALSMVWGHTCIFVEEQLVKGKAVSVPGLGTFSYIHKKIETGNKGARTLRTPVFIVADGLSQVHDLKKDPFVTNLTSSVPAVTLNHSLIASQSDSHRDVVMDFHKEAVRNIGHAIRCDRNMSIEMKNIGNLIFAGGMLKVVFNSDLVAQIQVSSTQRPSTPLPEELSDLNHLSAKVNNYLSSPIGSRNGTPRDDFAREKNSNMTKSAVTLPHVDRPKNPNMKLRSNSDTALRPLSALSERPRIGEDRIGEEEEGKEEDEDEGGCDDETCENCILDQMKARVMREKRAQDRNSEEASVRAQRAVLQALEDKDKLALRLQKAKREDADLYNRTVMGQRQESVVKQKKMDFYGDVFYARRPNTPENVKKATYKSALEEQISDKQSRTKQKQIEVKKEYEVFHETQKQADERARRLKLEEKQRLKDHGDFLAQQIVHRTTKEGSVNGDKFEKSVNNHESSGSKAFAEDLFRPSTAELKVKRRSFDARALDHHKEAIHQKKQREVEERASIVKEQLEMARINQETYQKEQQEELQKKLQTRDVLRRAWDTQMSIQRKSTKAEISQNATRPERTSLDLGQMVIERKKISKCKKCGRANSNPIGTRFRRASGDFRHTTNDIFARKAVLA